MHSKYQKHEFSFTFFLLANCCLFSTSSANIEFLFAFKEQVFIQEGNNPPATTVSWIFNAGVSGDSQVTGGTVVYPGSPGPVALTGQDGLYSTDSDDFASQAEMDTVFPNGQISLSIDDNGTIRNFGPFNLVDDTYPAPPHFINLVEIQSHDSSQDFVMEWSPFTGSDPDDKIIFQIFEPELEQDIMMAILPNDATSIVIPGGSLKGNFSYKMELFFLKETDGTESPESLIGYISSNYATFTIDAGGIFLNIPDEALLQAIKAELDIGTEIEVSFADLSELSSLVVASDQPLDLTGLEFASSLRQLTLNTGQISNFIAITGLEALDEVKLIAPQKEGLFFTHWSDGSQENPRILQNTGNKNFELVAQYSAPPLSPFAGGFSLVAHGTVIQSGGLPELLTVNVGDPYQLRFKYLILEAAKLVEREDFVSLDYFARGLLPVIGMEAELRIKNFKWTLRTTHSGLGEARIDTRNQEGTDAALWRITSIDSDRDQDFPFSYGEDSISLEIVADGNQGSLYNGPLTTPNRVDYLDWEAISSGFIDINSVDRNLERFWFIRLSHLPGTNQSYRLEKHPAYLDSTQRITGYGTNKPTAVPGGSTEHIDINWTDPYSENFETSYEVWRGINNNLARATLAATDLSNTSFRDLDVIPGRSYFYWIRAVRDGLKADYSPSVSSFRALAIPEDVQATQGDFPDRIRVRWTRVSGASSYSVYRSGTAVLNNAQLIEEGISGTEYEDFSPDTDDPYYYWVTSKAFDISSDFCEPVRGYRVANGITSLRASDGLYTDRVQINWDAFQGATSHTLYRNTVNNIDSASILATGITGTQYDDLPGAENQGVTFFYWVRPLNGVLPGSLSNTDPGYIPVQRNTRILAWGDNDFDQANIPDSNLLDIIEIAAGSNHSLALRSNGTIVGWGRNEFGQATPPPGLADVIDIAVGYDHSLALRRDGTVVGWGRNSFGKATVPETIPHVIDIEAGAEHSLALLADGSVVGWGSNDLGQIDIPHSLTQVIQIAAGGYHNIARRANGTVATWGDNSFGQRNIPGGITQVIDIAAGWNHCLVILPDGTVDGWGDNRRGQLDFPSDILAPPQAKGRGVRDPVTARIVDISGGLFHSLALSAKGELSAWGENKNSQIQSPETLGIISQIEAGNEFNLVVSKSALSIDSLIPDSGNLLSGEDLVLKVRATGGPDISYQWNFNNLAVEGATSDALLLSDVSLAEKGSYSVKVASGETEISSAPIQIEVTLNQAIINSQTVRAIRTYNGDYIFSAIETNPPGLKLVIRSSDRVQLPSTRGTHRVFVAVDQQGYATTPVENALILDTLDNEPLRVVKSDSGLTISYLAPEGFKSTLQMASDMREWITLAKVANGDGVFHDFNLSSPIESFYRVLFEVP